MTLHRPCAPDFEHFGPDATPSTPPHLFLQLKPFLQLQHLHPYHHLSTPLPIGMKHYLLRSAQMTWLPWNSSSKRTTQAKYLILTPLHQSDFGPGCISRKSTRWSNTSLSNFALVNIRLSHDRNQIIQTASKWNPTSFTTLLGRHSRDGHHINIRFSRDWFHRTSTVLRNAYVLCGMCHLQVFKAFDAKIAEHYLCLNLTKN